MSDLCFLAASLLTQGKSLGLQQRAFLSSESGGVAIAPTTRQPTADCLSTAAKENVSVSETHHPEFSQSTPKLNSPPDSLSSQPISTPPPPLVEPVAALEAPLQVERSVTPAIPDLRDSPPLDTPRPISGSQLFGQRVAALRAGRTYTRLPANSFQEVWANLSQQPTYEQWVNLLRQEAGAMARGQGSNRLTVMVGDSLYLWFPPERLPLNRFWLNQGISGDTTAGVLNRLPAFAQTRPDAIHVMVGINDLRRGATDAEVLSNLRQIMRQLHQAHPQAEIVVYSILPTRLAAIPSRRIHWINSNLAAIAYQEHVSYVDLLSYFADAQGNLRRDLTTDGLHLSRRGYAVWQWAMRSVNPA